PLPRINRVAARVEVQLFYRLAESAVRIARLRAKLYDHSGPQEVNQQHRKRDVLLPCRKRGEALGRRKANRMIERIQHRFVTWAERAAYLNCSSEYALHDISHVAAIRSLTSDPSCE